MGLPRVECDKNTTTLEIFKINQLNFFRKKSLFYRLSLGREHYLTLRTGADSHHFKQLNFFSYRNIETDGGSLQVLKALNWLKYAIGIARFVSVCKCSLRL